LSLLAKKYLPASFKGVPFLVDSVNYDGGRRVAVHEYPYKDVNFSEDLGRKRREYSFEAYVLGEDYEAQRDALILICEDEGGGDLVHPYLGTKQVVCTGFSLRESKAELGIAYFSFTFVEVGNQENPTSAFDPASKAKSTIEELQDISSAAFEKIYQIADAPSFVTNSAESNIQGFTDVVDGEAKKINGLTEKLADYTYQLRNMQADIRTIAQTPSRVAENFKNTLNNFLAVLPGGSNEMRLALKGITRYGVDFDDANNSTPSRTTESANNGALRDLSFELTTGLMASEAIDRIYASYEDAESSRDEVLDLIDEILNRTKDDNVYSGFYRLRYELLKAVPSQTQGLPRIVNFENTAMLPSLVVAYDIYESLELEPDLVSRNNVSHPGFMPANKILKALRFSDV
jgi:prophage DNA circulation protein